jgi:D-alanine-D-alanine ligase
MTKTAVVFGGPSPEHDISILTGLQAGRILAGAGLDLEHVYWTAEGRFLRVPGDLEAADFLDPDVRGAEELAFDASAGFVKRARLSTRALDVSTVLNCCHGGPGEDGTLAGMLGVAGVRVTGPGPTPSALAMDKVATAAVAHRLGIATIPTTVVDDSVGAVGHPAPWVVKPRYGGSSIGVEAGVADLETVAALTRQGAARAGALVQPYLQGWHDLHVAVRAHPRREASAIERPLRGEGAIYGYSDKYLAGGGDGGMESAPRELPAQVPDAVAEHVRDAALALAAEMGLTGIPRVDFLWNPADDQVLLCEVNAIPGALGLYLWEAAGRSRAEVLRDLLDEAAAGPARPAHWDGRTDRAALRAAGSIAAKLA